MDIEKEKEFLKIKEEKSIIKIEQATNSVKELRNDNEEGKLNLELYQREYIYSENGFRKASKVIETVLFGKILPSVIFTLNPKDGVKNIIDGQQRILSLIKFMANEFPLNLTEHDHAHMLNGLKFSNLSPELKRIIWNYRVPMIKVSVDNEKMATEIFLDLNYQSTPVSHNEIIITSNYGKIAKEAKRLSKLGEDGNVSNEKIWKLFGEQKNTKSGKIGRIIKKDRTGNVSVKVFKTMLSFVDKKVEINKDDSWIRNQVLESRENELSEYSLDKFEDLTHFIYETFKNDINSTNKEDSPLFTKTQKKVEFSSELSDILYLSISEILNKHGERFLQENRDKIKNEFIKIKNSAIKAIGNSDELNRLKSEFTKIIGEE